MIIKYERNTDDASDIEYEQIDETPYVQIFHEHTPKSLEFIERREYQRRSSSFSNAI
jgi:hypothetical protein